MRLNDLPSFTQTEGDKLALNPGSVVQLVLGSPFEYSDVYETIREGTHWSWQKASGGTQQGRQQHRRRDDTAFMPPEHQGFGGKRVNALTLTEGWFSNSN